MPPSTTPSAAPWAIIWPKGAEGFAAPYGPTTAEQRHPGFLIATAGDDCQWNGPSWPFSTAMTLTALANLINDYSQEVLTKSDYFHLLQVCTRSQRRRLEDGRIVPWIDENLDPFTGAWHAREMRRRRGLLDGRGDHYNHSTYCDLIITGLVGLRPGEGPTLRVNPLLPGQVWDWFCLDNVRYHGQILILLWDRTLPDLAARHGIPGRGAGSAAGSRAGRPASA